MRPEARQSHLLKDFLFQSTHPLRDATLHAHLMRAAALFQSTHPLRDATS